MSCGKKIKAKLIKFGDGYVAVCPICKKLAYNVKFKDSDKEEKHFKKGG
jgi:ribosome-binding protein aMBF1 (putative translation factor)